MREESMFEGVYRRIRGTVPPAAAAAFAGLSWRRAHNRSAGGPPFQFSAIGDTGYSKKSEEEFSRMIAAMNREPLAFVVHVGDFEADPRPYMRNPKTVTEPCTDESFKGVLAQFQQSAHPFILTPGDNG
jgi:hypothetical protein